MVKTNAVVFVLMQLLIGFSLTAAANLKVGVYNYIPDLQGDGLQTYKEMIEGGFNTIDHTVDAVVDSNHYSPYSNLATYLQDDDASFDLLEIDTATLGGITSLLMDVDELKLPLNEDTLPTAKAAVLIGEKTYGYPTLVCGNFLIGLSPGDHFTCPMSPSLNFREFMFISRCCGDALLTSNGYNLLFGGKMNDDDGWYLPYLYLDGYNF